MSVVFQTDKLPSFLSLSPLTHSYQTQIINTQTRTASFLGNLLLALRQGVAAKIFQFPLKLETNQIACMLSRLTAPQLKPTPGRVTAVT